MFPCPAGCVFSLGRKSSSSNRSNRRVLCLTVSLYNQWYITPVENYCFSRGFAPGTLILLTLFWTTVRQGAFSASAGRSSSNRSKQEGLAAPVSLEQAAAILTGRKLLFYGFRLPLDTFWAQQQFSPSGATVFPCPAGCVFSFGRKSSSSNRSSRRVLCLICLIVQPVV